MRWMRGTPYKPIAAHGVIGDMRTAAIVGMDGSIDWCCFPRFDSPSVFGAMLDDARGGRFRIAPLEPYTAEQRYLPLTNILVTTFHSHRGTGAAEVLDFMPVPGDQPLDGYQEIHRRIRGGRGEIELELLVQPRFDYARGETRLVRRGAGLYATNGREELVVAGPSTLEWAVDEAAAAARARVSLRPNEVIWLVLRYDADEVLDIDGYRSAELLGDAARYWNGWAGKLTYDGIFRRAVERSALALKLLFYEPTGAVVAAPTTSLPEEIGGSRNWDYRFCWLRDAAFTLSALHTIGLNDEAGRFMQFLEFVARSGEDTLQIMYGLAGETELTETTLPHLEGYRGSRPVRIGNGAHRQLQLDIYGELLEAAYLWHQQNLIGGEFWQMLVKRVDWVAHNWHRPDSGIWEVRAEPRHYVHSKLMCWVALDRAIRMAEQLGDAPNLDRWRRARATLREEILERGWSAHKNSFVQYYGGDALDASNLLIPIVGFLPGEDARVKSTIRATLVELTRDGMLYRYTNEDGLGGQEGVFSICTFWLADALILSGDVKGGERVFRRMLRFANHLGLYSEELDPRTGDFLGNFPQAFTHIALINTAQILERAYARLDAEPQAPDGAATEPSTVRAQR
jgi:GH15 family glucan-1,4-alpha-glucosidase